MDAGTYRYFHNAMHAGGMTNDPTPTQVIIQVKEISPVSNKFKYLRD